MQLGAQASRLLLPSASPKTKAVPSAKVDDGKLTSPVLTPNEGEAMESSTVLAPEEGGAKEMSTVLGPKEGDSGRSEDLLARKEPDSGSPNRLQRAKRRDLAARTAPGEVHRRLAAPK